MLGRSHGKNSQKVLYTSELSSQNIWEAVGTLNCPKMWGRTIIFNLGVNMAPVGLSNGILWADMVFVNSFTKLICQKFKILLYIFQD